MPRLLLVLSIVSLLFILRVEAQQHPSAVLTIVNTGQSASTGSLTLTVNGVSETANYGTFSTPASVAASFAGYFSSPAFSTAPPLCTNGICAKADGARILFQLEDGVSFASPIISSTNSTSPFAIDFSLWPQTTPQGTPSVSLNCTPDPVIFGSTATCLAQVAAGIPGNMTFGIDGNQWQNVAVDANGNATASGGLNGAAAGDHMVGVIFTANNTSIPIASAFFVVHVLPAGTISPGSTVLYSYAIQTSSGQSGYLGNGDIAAYTDSVNGNWVLEYDPLRRLTSSAQLPVGGNSAQYGCWSYDSFGNRLIQANSNSQLTPNCQATQGATSYYSTWMQFATGDNHISSRGTGNLSGVSVMPQLGYDDNGNVSTDQTYSYLYDAQGHLCAAHTAQGMTGYLYDAEGHRIAKGTLQSMSCDPTFSVNGQPNFTLSTLYVLGPDGETMTEIQGGSWARTHVSANGEEIATYDQQGIHYQVHDWLGTRRVQTNSAGAVENACSSQPFGDGQNCTNDAMDASSEHLTGKERDNESGFDYFGARYFNSSMGRWTSPDWSADPQAIPYATYGNPQTLNLYAYVGNNPLGRADVDGHCNGLRPGMSYYQGCDYSISPLEVAAAGFDAAVADTLEQSRQNAQAQQNNAPHPYVAPTGPGTEIGNILDPAHPSNPGPIGTGQCVEACRHYEQGLPDHTQWTQGVPVVITVNGKPTINPAVKPGTAIAAGWDASGHYPGPEASHKNSGVFLGSALIGPAGSIRILDQWQGSPGPRPRDMSPSGGYGTWDVSNHSTAYYVIMAK